MLMAKLHSGVLHVKTVTGLRCVPLSFSKRLLLLWTFRHFSILPEEVLNRRERRLVTELSAQARFMSDREALVDNTPVIGTVDRTPVRQPAVAVPRWLNTGEARSNVAIKGGRVSAL